MINNSPTQYRFRNFDKQCNDQKDMENLAFATRAYDMTKFIFKIRLDFVQQMFTV